MIKSRQQEKLDGDRNYTRIRLVRSRLYEGEVDLRFESGQGMATVISLRDLDIDELRSALGTGQ